jgi:hypothetical protein
MDVAAVGGLNRIAALMSIGGFAFGSVVAPRFSRELDPRKLRSRFWLSICALLLISLGSALPMVLFPSGTLWLLGQEYAHLKIELIICCAGSALYLIYSGIYALAIGRGNLVKPWTFLAVSLAWQIALLATFDLRSLIGVLWVGALTPVPGIVAYFVAALRGLAREETTLSHEKQGHL